MSDPALASEVDALLGAIDDDSPHYRTLLRALLMRPDALAALRADALLCARIAPELRKLRPLALWVWDDAEVALEAKRVLALDGAICRRSGASGFPASDGRECWAELPAATAAEEIDALPRGFGVVVSGHAQGSTLAAVSARAPLRALGVALTAPLPPLPEVRLDLVVLARGVGPLTLPGARTLWTPSSPEALRAHGAPARSAGVVCAAHAALSWALQLASLRLPRDG